MLSLYEVDYSLHDLNTLIIKLFSKTEVAANGRHFLFQITIF